LAGSDINAKDAINYSPGKIEASRWISRESGSKNG